MDRGNLRKCSTHSNGYLTVVAADERSLEGIKLDGFLGLSLHDV